MVHTCARPRATTGSSTRPPRTRIPLTFSIKRCSRWSLGRCLDTPYVDSTITAEPAASSLGQICRWAQDNMAPSDLMRRPNAIAALLSHRRYARSTAQLLTGDNLLAMVRLGSNISRTLLYCVLLDNMPGEVIVCHDCALITCLFDLTDVRRVVRRVCSRKMPIRHSAVVSSVQQPHACYFHLKHASPQYMSGSVSCHLHVTRD